MQECVTVSISGDALVLQSSNNTRALVARHRLQRSPILQQALEDCDMCKPIQINVPSRFTEAWAELLKFEDESDAKAKSAIPSSSLVLYVQASDFFSDDIGIMYACSALSHRVFNPAARPPGQLEGNRQRPGEHELSAREENPSTTRQVRHLRVHKPGMRLPKCSSSMMWYIVSMLCIHQKAERLCCKEATSVNILSSLPPHLVERLCSASSSTLSEQLQVLPTAFHPQALLACFPSIIQSRSCAFEGIAEGRWLSATSYCSVFQAVAAFSALKHLTLNFYFLKDVLEISSIMDLLAQTLTSLSDLQSLYLTRVSPLVPGLERAALWSAIASLSSLTNLTLEHADLTQQHVAHIATTLQSLTCLQKFSLQLSPWTDIWRTRSTFSADQLLESIQKLPCLQHLDICVQGGCLRIDSRGANALLLSFSTNLAHLDVQGCHLGSLISSSLLPTSLRFLDVSGNMLTSKSMLELVTALHRMKDLETLNMHEPGVQLDSRSVSLLCVALTGMSQLQHLALAGLQGITAVGDALGPTFRHLTSLKSLLIPVLRPWDDVRPFSAFCAALPSLTGLTSLTLEGIMPVEYGFVLSRALRHLQRLSSLDINVLSLPSEASECRRSVAAILSAPGDLQEVKLRGADCVLGHERHGSIEGFAAVLGTLRKLRHLELQFRGDRVLEQRAMIKILAALQSLTALCVFGGELLGRSVDDEVFEGVAPLTTLHHLRIHNAIERWPRDFHGYSIASRKDHVFQNLRSLDLKVALDSDARVLCALQIIARCSCLLGLKLSACNMDDVVAKDLARMIGCVPKLQVLDVTDNAISIEGAKSLATALQGHSMIEILDLSGCMHTASEADAWNALGSECPFINFDESYDHGVNLWKL